jgi:hypothetical protein
MLKLHEEKSKHAGLAQENGFEVAYLHSLREIGTKPSKARHMPKEECNKYDITMCLSLFVIVQGGLLLLVSHLFCRNSVSLNFVCGLQKSK